VSLGVDVWVLGMRASIMARRPDAGASTAHSPATRPGKGDDGGEMPVTAFAACTLSLATKSSSLIAGLRARVFFLSPPPGSQSNFPINRGELWSAPYPLRSQSTVNDLRAEGTWVQGVPQVIGFSPVEKLRRAVDLIVVARIGEGE